MSELNWMPPSPEGARHPDEIEQQFSRVTAALHVAFETHDSELFQQAMAALHAILALAVDQLRAEG